MTPAPFALAVVVLIAPAARAEAPAGISDELVLGRLNAPTDLAFLPDGTMLVACKDGELLLADPAASPAVARPMMTVADVHFTYAETGVMAVVLDPAFAANGYFYLYYAHAPTRRFRVSRFRHHAGYGDADSELVLWRDDEEFRTCCHWGGDLVVGPDSTLYLTTGDKTRPQDRGHRSQDLGLAAGKVHRFGLDGTVPADNPFFDGPGPNRDSVWALGLRNPFRAAFDQTTERLLIADVGYVDFEEVNVGRAGANYGWPACEGVCNDPRYDDPIFSYPTSPHASVTGGLVYRGRLLSPEVRGAYVFGDYVRRSIRAVILDGSGENDAHGDRAFDLLPLAGDVVALAEGPDGAIYYVNLSGSVRRITLETPGLRTAGRRGRRAATTINPDAASLD